MDIDTQNKLGLIKLTKYSFKVYILIMFVVLIPLMTSLGIKGLYDLSFIFCCTLHIEGTKAFPYLLVI